MIRLTELRLPLEHSPAELRAAIAARLGLDASALRGFTVFRRGHDARKKAAIVAVYTLDCEVADDDAVLARHQGDPHVRPTPDMRYRFVAQAPADFGATRPARPIVVGFGPCGIFAALVARRQTPPAVLERGPRYSGRATPGACMAASSIRSQRAAGKGRRNAPRP
jgi:uncharacterized FAD-dependent dehydrogenase